MSLKEQVLLVCLNSADGSVMTSDATLDVESGILVNIVNVRILQASGDPSLERFIRLKGHPARFRVDVLAATEKPLYRITAEQMAPLRAALAHRGAHPCVFSRETK